MKKFLFGFLCVLIGFDAMIAESYGEMLGFAGSVDEKCPPWTGTGTKWNNNLQIVGQNTYFLCDSGNEKRCAIGACIASLGGEIRNDGETSYSNKVFCCSKDFWGSFWTVEQSIPQCSQKYHESAVLQKNDLTKTVLVWNGHVLDDYFVKIGRNSSVKINGQERRELVKIEDLCLAYICDYASVPIGDGSTCGFPDDDSNTGIDGASGNGDGNDNGSGGAVVQNTGDGSGDVVVQNKAGDECLGPDLSAVNYATAGVYVNSGGTLKCAATACKSGTYLVVNASGQSMGWCVAANYCSSVKKQKNHTLNIIDGTKTDLQCIAPSGDGDDKTSSTVIANTEQEYTVSGTVVDGEQEPLASATINVGTSWHLVTDENGAFSGTYTGQGSDEATVRFTNCTEQKITISELHDKQIVLDCGELIDSATVTGDFVSRDCNPDERDAINATAGQTIMRDGVVVCNPSACKNGFNLNETNPEYNTCDEDSTLENNDDTEEIEDEIEEETEEDLQEDDLAGAGLKPVTPRLSQQESEQKVGELRDNYNAMKENEQSFANRMLGAASMGSMGIGGMMVASSLSEQKSDADAEQDMAAYLETFRCDYGAGRNIKGGETNIELPGASELIPLYSEYVSLANDLKLRKEQLGLKAGIEAEKILDSATTGLYDDVSTGITGGAYASLARALQNPDGEDAKLWAAQKEKTAKNLKTGAITAGVGAVVGIAGNVLINHKVKNNANEIVTRYESMKRLKQDVDNIPPATTQCPGGTSGVWPFCRCAGDAEFISELNKCENCTGGQVAVVENDMQKCSCPDDKPLWDSKAKQCVAEPVACTPQCQPTEGSNLVVLQDCKCECINGFRMGADGACECDGKVEDGICVIVQVQNSSLTLIAETETSTVSLNADNLFKIGSSELRDEAKGALREFASNLKNQDGVTDCEIEIIGYTDPVGSADLNRRLSKQRADAVSDYLKFLPDFQSVILAGQPTVRGMGENSCFCGAGTMPVPEDKASLPDYKVCVGEKEDTQVTGNDRYAPCRRVDIEATCKKTTTSSAVIEGLVDGLAGN